MIILPIWIKRLRAGSITQNAVSNILNDKAKLYLGVYANSPRENVLGLAVQ
ncbi:hypothetical protein TUM4433_26820 [Shewanella schlegeliana]|nr:hypothetical protein TUM4433_26820 [Shewanella schlegeliana]